MIRLKLLLCILLGFAATEVTFSQCNVLRQQRSVTFNTDGECAPVDVTDFSIEYTFSVAQNPANIAIVFYWNDADNNEERIDGTDLIVSPDNKSFKATATFTYIRDANCLFTPQAFIEVSGTECETSEQEQFVSAWDNDDSFGGTLAITPDPYSVCFGNAIVNAVFEDNSTFNCNPNQNADNPNELTRHVQFVYGSNHNAANSIRNLSVNDGGAQSLTNGTGALSSSDTRGTAGLQVTAAYFGTVTPAPFPATGPNAQSLPISAPADAANVVGSTFEVTMYNWNTCNPWNGDSNDPNYEDAVSETAVITIVNPPNPSFQSRFQNAGGAIQTTFCIGEDIYFENLTAGGYAYLWEFFDDETGTGSLGTSGNASPTFSFNSSGQKLVRLSATDGSVQGSCTVVYEGLVELTASAVSDITLFDQTFTTAIDGDFCQTGGSTFTVGFRDGTTGIQSDTRWRWEFYNESNTLIESLPTGAGNYSATQITDFTRDYSATGSTRVRLIARNIVTQCESIHEDTVNIYVPPQAAFSYTSSCEGNRTTFSAIADSVTSLSPRVNNDRVILYEWDFSYDGVTFNPELSRTNDQNFSRYLDGVSATEPTISSPGTYRIALRMTTEKGGCAAIVDQNVTVFPLPVSSLTSDYTSVICPGGEITFTNTSSNPGLTMTYELSVRHTPSGFLQTINMTSVDTVFTFTNSNDTLRTYRVRLRSLTSDGCERNSTEIFVQVYPDEDSGFDDPAYDFRVTNCSPWSSTFFVDDDTDNLNADQYTWSLFESGVLMAGYPVTRLSSAADFNEFAYTIENTSGKIQTYSMLLEVTKAGTCVGSSSYNVLISPQPDGSFEFVQQDDCQEVVFELEATQKGLPDYQWTFDPAPASVLSNDDLQLVTYDRELNSGSDFPVAISLVTLNLADCPSEEASELFTITKRDPDVVADFTVSADTIQLPDSTISLQNNSSSGAVYAWDFGDGSISTNEEPGTHSYSRYGAYEIDLVTTIGFCSAMASHRVVVLAADPVIDFEADILEGCSPLTVQFTNLSQFAETGKFIWEFGDGSISRQDNPTYTFYEGGDFTVRLRGENEVGTVRELEIEAYIHVYGLPFADFLASPRVVYIPTQQVFFSNLSRNGVSYFWDFGDGQTSTEENPKHTYGDEGFYDITLIAENGFGCKDTLFRDTEIRAVKGGDVSSPNAFTPDTQGPNGGDITVGGNSDPDRINDIFLPRLEGVTKFRMLIYNKWGQLVFESTSQNVGWDGYFNGRLAPAGVYLYKLELKFSSGQELIKVGDLTLIR